MKWKNTRSSGKTLGMATLSTDPYCTSGNTDFSRGTFFQWTRGSGEKMKSHKIALNEVTRQNKHMQMKE